MKGFEAHVTIPRERHEDALPIAKAHDFKMSNITDDPVLGPGAKAYCTGHSDDLERLIGVMGNLTFALRMNSIPVLRRKIEVVVIDEVFSAG
jgi:hypothetical protein